MFGTLMGFKFKNADYQRFWSKVNKTNNGDDCWYWGDFSKEKTGYGRFYVQGRVFHASQVSLALSGVAVQTGDNVLHSQICVVRAEENFGDGTIARSCCNPKHLRVGTQKENSQDTKALGRMRGLFDGSVYNHGETHPFAKLSKSDVESIKLDNRNYTEIAKTYGVRQSTISRIKSGKRRKLG